MLVCSSARLLPGLTQIRAHQEIPFLPVKTPPNALIAFNQGTLPVTTVIDNGASISEGLLSWLTNNLSALSDQSNISAFYVHRLASLGGAEGRRGGARERSTVALNHLKILNEGCVADTPAGFIIGLYKEVISLIEGWIARAA